MKFARPSECSAAAEMFVLLASGDISDISCNALVGAEGHTSSLSRFAQPRRERSAYVFADRFGLKGSAATKVGIGLGRAVGKPERLVRDRPAYAASPDGWV